MVHAPRELPAQLEPAVEKTLRDMAARVARLSGLRGVARIDFLADDDQLYVNEINTIPGSLSWYLWVDPPVAFAQLLADMLAEAVARPSAFYTTAGADGTALRSAGSIASKLG
jgi:D-alanine-D-alanine ligase